VISFNWSFPTLEYASSVDGLSQVIKTVHWRITAVEDNYVSATYGSTGLPNPQPDEFVDYDDLTAQLVQSWTEAAMGETAIEQIKDNLKAQINIAKQPELISSSPPWEK
jgi:hypothetical protein